MLYFIIKEISTGTLNGPIGFKVLKATHFEISVMLYFIIKESSTGTLNGIIGFKVLRATHSTEKMYYNINE